MDLSLPLNSSTPTTPSSSSTPAEFSPTSETPSSSSAPAEFTPSGSGDYLLHELHSS